MGWWDDFVEGAGNAWNAGPAKWLGDLYEGFKDWSGFDQDDENKVLYWLSSVPGIGDLIDTKNNWDQINDYLDNRGLTWSDVEYPGSQFGPTVNWHNLNYVSDNLERLYDDDDGSVSIWRGDRGRFTTKRP